jgi:hypothetical protein
MIGCHHQEGHSMPTWLLPLILDVLPQIPNFISEGKNLFGDLSKQEGGTQKIADIMGGLSHLMAHGAQALGSSVPPPKPSAVIPMPESKEIHSPQDPADTSADELNAAEAAQGEPALDAGTQAPGNELHVS